MSAGSSRGDQYVTVVVETPTHLTKEQKDQLRQFEAGASEGFTQNENPFSIS